VSTRSRGVLNLEYSEALAWLESLGRFGSRPGLQRIQALLEVLGHPEQGLEVVHVAGTNGKGSVCAYISSILAAAGYRTGLYTSPHLVSYTERLQVNGQEVPEPVLARLLTQVRQAAERVTTDTGEHPTEFEVLTAAAFLYFNVQKVDYLVLEVGLGGRLDATNVVFPQVAVITNISHDHVGVLGTSIAAIAREKAGIIKPGRPVVMAPQEEEAAQVIVAVAKEWGSPLLSVRERVALHLVEESLQKQRFHLQLGEASYQDVVIHLLGRHQLDNAATAILAIDVLCSLGAEVKPDALYQGLAATRWPARFEVMSSRPVVIVDGAHNLAGAQALARAVRDYLPGRRVVLLIGVLADKDVSSILRELGPLGQAAVVTRPDSPRAADLESVADGLSVYVPHVVVEPDVRRAVDRALALACRDDVVLVCGSLYLVGWARKYIGRTHI
jgi:dihydrofolate synthase/folylpolyglutamate synthase